MTDIIQYLPKPLDLDAIADAEEIDPETRSLLSVTSLRVKLLSLNNLQTAWFFVAFFKMNLVSYSRTSFIHT